MKPGITAVLRGVGALAGLSLGLAGCAVVDAVYGPERWESLTGKSLEDVVLVQDMTIRNGQLILAQGGGKNRGIVYVDMASGAVVRHVKLDSEVRNFISAFPEALCFNYGFSETQSLHTFDVPSGRIISGLVTDLNLFNMRESPSVNESFMADAWNGSVYRVTLDNNTPVIRLFAGGLQNPLTVARVGPGAYVSSSAPFITVIDTSRSPARRDSIDLGIRDTTKKPHVVGHGVNSFGGRTFAIVNLTDTSWVAELDTSSRTVIRTIPLAFRGVRSAGVHNGAWYLFGIGPRAYPDWPDGTTTHSGIERIDLTSLERSTIVSALELNGQILDFLPATQSFGYVRYVENFTYGHTPLRKITY